MIDGMDVIAVLNAAREAVTHARSAGGPSFLICNTYRFGGHYVGDKQNYKDRAEADSWNKKDPIIKLGQVLNGLGVNGAALDRIDGKVRSTISAAVAFARQSPETTADQLETYLYAY